MLQTVLFYLISFGMVIASLGVVTSRSAIYSILCLVTAMGLMAGLFVLLKAFLVATILILVYAGALLVLFLFVTMMVDLDRSVEKSRGFGLSPILAITVSAFFFAEAFLVIRSVPGHPTSPGLQGTTAAIGQLLFSRHVLAFEMTSFLILAAIVSVVVLAKKDTQ